MTVIEVSPDEVTDAAAAVAVAIQKFDRIAPALDDVMGSVHDAMEAVYDAQDRIVGRPKTIAEEDVAQAVLDQIERLVGLESLDARLMSIGLENAFQVYDRIAYAAFINRRSGPEPTAA